MMSGVKIVCLINKMMVLVKPFLVNKTCMFEIAAFLGRPKASADQSLAGLLPGTVVQNLGLRSNNVGLVPEDLGESLTF